MGSRYLMIGLGAFYLVIAGVAVHEQHWPVAMYWVCAAGILTAVLWMGM